MNKTAVALGTFDGIHLGHKKVLERAINSGFTPIVITFATPPKIIMNNSQDVLISAQEKKNALLQMGFKDVQLLDFERIRKFSPKEFLDMLKCDFDCTFISCGFNYRFGEKASGDTLFLAEYCARNGIKLCVTQPVKLNGEIISSTRIRNLLQNGEISKANSLCMQPFGFLAEIVHGDARGRRIGFPTVNQMYPKQLCRVKFGVYKSQINVCGKKYNGMTNIGIRPTYKTDYVSAETYIFGFSGNIYGAVANLRLMEFIRPEQKFASLDQLKSAIANDAEKINNQIKSNGPEK